MRRACNIHLFDMPQKLLHLYVRISQRALERIAIHFRMIGEHDAASVGMFHLDVAASPVDFHKAKTRQCGQYLSAGEEGQIHEISTTSRVLSSTIWPGAGSRYNSMASRTFCNASSRVLPCDQQLFRAGQCATYCPSSPSSTITLTFMLRVYASYGKMSIAREPNQPVRRSHRKLGYRQRVSQMPRTVRPVVSRPCCAA